MLPSHYAAESVWCMGTTNVPAIKSNAARTAAKKGIAQRTVFVTPSVALAKNTTL